MDIEIRSAAAAALAEPDPAAKVAAVEHAGARLDAGAAGIDPALALSPPLEPGRPARPVLVEPRGVPRRSVHTGEGRIALLHAVAHIEFNAVNLALDAVARFEGLARAFYRDWFQVAREEARHHTMVARIMASRGSRYGDLPAHDGLWEMARRTADDPLARMALVPRVLEARGLDVTPAMRAGLAGEGDDEAAAALDVILADEIGHVAAGNRWFRHLCAARGEDPEAAFTRLRTERRAPGLHPPFNLEARAAAGFTEQEMAGFAAANRAAKAGRRGG